MRVVELTVSNLSSEEQVAKVREIIEGITGAVFERADLKTQEIEFGLKEDLDDLTITDVQCALRDAGFEAGEVVPGVTCNVRLSRK
jgi:copper chaperone CopZ